MNATHLFRKNGADPVPVIIVRPLVVPDEADEEVGPMFRVQLPDGINDDAFGDELEEIR